MIVEWAGTSVGSDMAAANFLESLDIDTWRYTTKGATIIEFDLAADALVFILLSDSASVVPYDTYVHSRTLIYDYYVES